MLKKGYCKIICIMVTILFATIFLGGCSLVENLLFTKPVTQEFSFSGYVLADGEALEGASVDCGLSVCETDDNGYYSFNSISKVVQVKVSKQGYLFSDDLVFISSTSSGVNFNGFKYFDKTGVVKNNNVPVADVEICAVSKSGTYVTKTNEYGEFYLPLLAGEVKVVAKHSNYKFFTQAFTIAKEDTVLMTGTTNIVGKILVDTTDFEVDDFVLKYNNEEIVVNDDLSFNVSNAVPEAEFTLSSDKYYVKQSLIKVVGLENKINFECEKYYSISGSVKSGSSYLKNATIVYGDNEIDCIDGKFSLNNLHGEYVFSAKYEDFTFEDANVDRSTDTVNIIGKAEIDGKITLDYGRVYEDIKIKAAECESVCDANGKFILTGIQLGDIITIDSSTYALPESVIIVDTTDISLNLFKLFSASVLIKYNYEFLDGVSIKVDNQNYATTGNEAVMLDNLYGNRVLSLSKEGYIFEDEYHLSFSENALTINPLKIFTLTGNVHSAEIIIAGAEINTPFGDTQTDEEGNFSIANVYGDFEASVLLEGYNSCKMNASIINNNLDINLYYDIYGTINCGEQAVEDVRVSVGDKEVYSDTDGAFNLKKLSGQVTVSFYRQHYNFSDESVCKAINLSVNTSYKLSGNVSDSIGNISDFKVVLLDLKTYETTNAYTDSQGNFEFDNIDFMCVLTYDDTSLLSLKPRLYDINCGGIYNFSDKGYSFGGKVTCGNVPLSDVVVKMGDNRTKTNENGVYNFSLISTSGVVTLEKLGYTFVNNGLSVNESFDERGDVDFVATYCVKGTVASGDTLLENVKVSIKGNSTISSVYTNDQGSFEISGLVGNNELEFDYFKYRFVGDFNVDKHQVINVKAVFDIKLQIKSGNVIVENVDVRVGEKVSTYEDEAYKVYGVQLGEEFTLIKEGYVFEDLLITEYSENILETNCSYSVKGNVFSASVALEGVQVVCGGLTTTTDENGEFELNNLRGLVEITFEKEGFDFDTKTVSGAQTISISSKFSIKGVIKVGSLALGGVEVSALGKTVTSNAIGYFEITNLCEETTLSLVKEGYEFHGNLTVNGPSSLTITATYKVMGYIKSGTIPLSNATISASNGQSTTSDTTGYYELSCLDAEVSLTVTREDYNNGTKSAINKYLSNCNFDLSYNITVSFDGVDDYSDITIKLNQVGQTHGTDIVTINNLTGTNEITFERTNYKFTPQKLIVNKATTINSHIDIVYSITGFVKTKSGVAIANAIVSAGNESAISDNSGKYTLNNLMGTNRVKVQLPSFTDSVYSLDLEQVSTETTLNISIQDNDFAYNLLMYSYDRLRNANSYQIFGAGTVTPGTDLAKPQNVTIIYKQDSQGNKIFENKNYGEVISILGITVDPNVSLLSCFNMNTREVKYQQIFGVNEVTQANVNYKNSWDATSSFANYKDTYGVDGNSFYPYTINDGTISSISNVTVNGGNYEFTILLKCNSQSAVEASYNSYGKLMKKMCPAQSLIGFSKIALKYTITKDGYLRVMKINENYIVTSKGMDVSTSAEIIYNFYINSMTEVINNIDTTSPITVANDLTQEEPTETQALSMNLLRAILPIRRREWL